MEAFRPPNRSNSFRHQLLNLVLAEPRAIVYGLMLLLSVGVLGWWFAKDFKATATNESDQKTVVASLDAVEEEQAIRRCRADFFESQVLSKLEATDEANRLAAKRCLQRIEQNFDGYRAGVGPFVDDITGIQSRFGILKRMPGGWWNGDERVNKYVTEKFEQHLFSEATLTDDLRSSLESFRNDVRANQRELLIRTRAAISQSDLPPIELDDYESFFEIVNQQIRALTGDEAKTSVTDGLVSLIVSEAGSTAVGMIAGRFVAGFTASSATAIAASGGATAGGAAAGAAGGSMVPGPGTIAGFAVGLVVGLGIDYWMTNQTAASLRSELLLYIDRIESDLLNGPASAPANIDVRQGIASGIDTACELLRDGVHQRLFDIIVLEQSP